LGSGQDAASGQWLSPGVQPRVGNGTAEIEDLRGLSQVVVRAAAQVESAPVNDDLALLAQRGSLARDHGHGEQDNECELVSHFDLFVIELFVY
jgi:hypothetical protein